MNENARKFAELVTTNEDVQEALGKLANASADEMVAGTIALAKEHGIELTPEDLNVNVSEDLGDDDLDAVAGGGSITGLCPLIIGGGTAMCDGRTESGYMCCKYVGIAMSGGKYDD